jgi:aryl-alcohol dehydrogenase-like predicted oxidoreductase
MKFISSRRAFLVAGTQLPLATLAASGIPFPLARDAPMRTGEPGKLTFRQLGKTGLTVSSLGFGCMTTSDSAVIERAADLGINFFDTARAYQNGNNERLVGSALKGKRQKVIISSKTLARTKQDALADLDTSLRELQTDYVDIWYLHSKSTGEEVTDDLLEAQRIAKKGGKIRFAGVSAHFNMPEMLGHLVERGQTEVALISYNFTMKPELTSAIQTARRAGMGIVAMKVLAGGLARIKRGDRLYGQNPDALTATLKQEGAMLAAIKWTLKNESVDTAIVCITDFEQLDENFRAMSEPFTGKDQGLLAAQLAMISPLYCRMCGNCRGVCERGVPVSDTLRFLTYAEGYREFALARGRFLELPEQVRQIRCAECQSCSVSCPNGVEVRSRLIRAQELLG